MPRSPTGHVEWDQPNSPRLGRVGNRCTVTSKMLGAPFLRLFLGQGWETRILEHFASWYRVDLLLGSRLPVAARTGSAGLLAGCRGGLPGPARHIGRGHA